MGNVALGGVVNARDNILAEENHVGMIESWRRGAGVGNVVAGGKEGTLEVRGSSLPESGGEAIRTRGGMGAGTVNGFVDVLWGDGPVQVRREGADESGDHVFHQSMV